MKKLRCLALLPFLSLTSCAQTSDFLGTYSFMLGRKNDSHVRVAMELTEEDYLIGEKVAGKKFKGEIDAGAMITVTDEMILDVLPGVDPDEIRELVVLMTGKTLDELVAEKLKNLDGYYSINENVSSAYGYRLKLGTSIFGDLDVPQEVMEYIISAYANGKSVTLQIPVSITDLQMQLCWYGLLVDFDNKEGQIVKDLTHDGTILLPGEQDIERRVGTHPKFTSDARTGQILEDQITEMNETFAGDFSNSPIYEGEKTEKKIGSFYVKNDELYMKAVSDFAPQDANISATIMLKNSYRVYDIATPVNMVVDKNSINEHGYGRVIEVKTKIGKELFTEDFLQKPFVFRDYHDIRISLAKEA